MAPFHKKPAPHPEIQDGSSAKTPFNEDPPRQVGTPKECVKRNGLSTIAPGPGLVPMAWAKPLLELLQQDPLPPLKEGLAIPERLLIMRALDLTGGSKAAAAAMLGLSRSTLYQKMGKYRLPAGESSSLGA